MTSEQKNLKMVDNFNITQFEGKGVGIGPKSIEKLQAAGMNTVFDICIRGSQELSEITGMSQGDIDEAMRASYKIIEDSGRCRKREMTVLDLYNYRMKLPKIKTLSSKIDGLLKGGIEMEATTEVYGEYASGKTQFCNTLAVEAIQQHGFNVLWIDCEDTFDPGRIIEIIIARGYAKDEEEAKDKFFDKITYKFVPNTDMLVSEVNHVSYVMLEKDIKLIIIDGSIGQFRQEYIGRGTLSIRQNNLARFMGHLSNIAFFFNCAIVFTNQVQADPSMMFGDPIKPIGGNVVGHSSTYRLYFKKLGSKRVARMVDSPKGAVEDVRFSLTDKGVEDEKK